MSDIKGIYHEKQSKELCALHVLNNLFQDKAAFCKQDLDEICVSLSPQRFLNPHRSVLGLGNYDVNVLMAALQRKDMACVWFDKRKDVRVLDLSNIAGLILNVPSEFGLGFVKLPLKRKHWFAIRQIKNTYYNLDSKLSGPERLGSEQDVKCYLRDQLQDGDKELLLVVTQKVDELGSWQKSAGKDNKSSDVT